MVLICFVKIVLVVVNVVCLLGVSFGMDVVDVSRSILNILIGKLLVNFGTNIWIRKSNFALTTTRKDFVHFWTNLPC